ncbi:MAG: hypothetical protein J6Y05_08755 [Bacteroidales bacterium]|nr:hypothetical protein [Bacteroidales bacterium]
MKKTILPLLLTYLLLLLTFTLLMLGTYTLPSSLITDNVIASAQQLQHEGQAAHLINSRLGRLDNYTDALMLNLAISSDTKHPLRSAMLNPYYDNDDEDVAKSVNTERVAHGQTNGLEKRFYGRYWQGYLVTLKPMLILFSLHGLRIVNCLLMLLLSLATLWLIWQKIGKIESLLFLLSLLLVYFPVVPFSLQYSTCFYLMFLSMLAVMLYPVLTSTSRYLSLTFFVIGGITSFFDFLTTPQLTLGMTLLVCLLIHRKQEMRTIIMASIAWGIGYALLWASKWVIGYGLTGFNLLADAAEQIGVRTSQQYYGIELTIPTMLQFIIFGEERPLGWKIPALILALSIAYIFLQKGLKVQRQYLWLLLIAMIVPVWFLLMRQHSIMHLWFTLRAFLVTIYSLLLWLFYTLRSPR